MQEIKNKGFQKNLESFFGRPKLIKRSGKKVQRNVKKMNFKK